MKEERPEGRPPTSRRPSQDTRSITQAADSVDEVLARVRRYEAAARGVADDETLPVKARCRALLELSHRGRHEELPAFVEAGSWRGCRGFREGDKRVPRDVIEANRRLLRRGHVDCPTCRRPLPSSADLDRWRALGHDLGRPA
jgi:hypothetical protein